VLAHQRQAGAHEKTRSAKRQAEKAALKKMLESE